MTASQTLPDSERVADWPRITATLRADGTGGLTEAINNVIETTRRIARGFRNFDNYRLRILASASGQRPYRQPPKPVKQGQPNHAE